MAAEKCLCMNTTRMIFINTFKSCFESGATWCSLIVNHMMTSLKWKPFPRCWPLEFPSKSATELWCFFDVGQRKQLNKPWSCWWLETTWRPLWSHFNEPLSLFCSWTWLCTNVFHWRPWRCSTWSISVGWQPDGIAKWPQHQHLYPPYDEEQR